MNLTTFEAAAAAAAAAATLATLATLALPVGSGISERGKFLPAIGAAEINPVPSKEVGS